MGKKKFIDKKRSATFALLYRASSEGQELGDDRVYTRVDNNLYQVPEFEGGGDEEDDDESRFEDAEEGEIPSADAMPEKLRRELLEMGFPDDGYNYMKHMRAVGAGVGALFVPTTSQEFGNLPVDVKAYDASRVHVEESLSEKDLADESFTGVRRLQAAPAKMFDHVVRAALDESGEEGGEGSDLEDDFVLLANKEDEGECSSRVSPPAIESHHDDNQHEESQHPVTRKVNDERSTRLLDEQFEVLALKEYDDDELEDEDDPRAKGSAELSQFESILDEFLAENPILCGRQPAAAPHTSEKRSAGAQEVAEDEDGDGEADESWDEEEDVQAVWVDDDDADDARGAWDCESIVSTFSNLDNHPSRIGCPGGAKKRVQFSSVVTEQTIRLGGRQKLPVDFIGKPRKESGKTSPSGRSGAPAATRGETREERKAHKAAVKEERRASRKAKKEIKTEFKRAAQRAQAGAAGVISRSIKL